MLSYFYVILTYAILVVSVPFIVSTACFGDLDSVLSRLAYKLNLHYSLKQVEPVVLCVGIIAFYSYVILGFLVDVIQAYRSQNAISLRGRARLDRFEQANKELHTLFPSFIVSSFLLYANTTRFDTLRNSFILLQTILLLLQPIATMYPRPNPSLVCKYFYRAVLFWSFLYAILPRETNHFILAWTRFFNTLFTTDSTSLIYTNNNDIHQWIL